MNREELERHVFSTYITLRYGMAILAFLFPLILFAGGVLHDIPLQNSMSAYYHAVPIDKALPQDPFAPRSLFVGILCAIGAFLYLYKGFSKLENILLNIAGLCAWGVALYPMPWNCAPLCPSITPHYLFAVTLFACIAAVSVYCAKQTLYLVTDAHARRRFALKYNLLGAAMLLSPIAAIMVSFFFGAYRQHVFFIEAAGVLAFAAYWWVKSRELALSEADRRVVGKQAI